MDKAKNFAIWLDGFLDGRETLNEEQTLKVKEKLNGIFDHEAMDNLSDETTESPTNSSYVSFGESFPKQDGETVYRC